MLTGKELCNMLTRGKARARRTRRCKTDGATCKEAERGSNNFKMGFSCISASEATNGQTRASMSPMS